VGRVEVERKVIGSLGIRVVNPRYSGLETKKLWQASALPSKIDKLSGLTISCTDS
jgi:hypothetical protein